MLCEETHPFKMTEVVPGQDRLSSILVQDEVLARFSGALLTDLDQQPIIEGVRGFGDEFMLGRVGPSQLDQHLMDSLTELHTTLVRSVGSVRAEWAFDGKSVWMIQLQQEEPVSTGRTIVSGSVD